MMRRQTVLGFFDNAAEAQQAVQLLLAKGFTQKTVELSTPAGLNVATGNGPAAPTGADNSSGRFSSSLFGSRDEDQSRSPRWARPGEPGPRHTGAGPNVARPEMEVPRRSGTLITVQTQSVAEAQQVTDLLNTAGAADVVMDERTNPNRRDAAIVPDGGGFSPTPIQ